MSFRWVYSSLPTGVKVSVHSIEQQLNVPGEIAWLLALRNISSYEEARAFFRPEKESLYDPFLMKDMEEGACRLSAAICNRERVLIYGDYDVDGITATCLLYTFLKKFGLDVDIYIPHRFKEGYGINIDGINTAIEKKASLIVSVDCGITAIEEANYAREQGIDLVICDHHTVGNSIPDAVAVLDPKRPDCSYPFDGLSGAGVGFKLIQGTIKKLGLSERMADPFLDLVAISIASDIVPIVDENRVMMRRGLELINISPRTGIKALLDRIGVPPGSVSTSNIVFAIGPRINAAGRMGDATAAVELLIAEDKKAAEHSARQLEAINMKRRDTDSETMNQAVDLLEREFNLEEISTMVLHNPDWHLGVIGIVASRLVDAYHRPAIMLSTVDGQIKGSARSIKGFNIYDALKECEDLLERFGGHEFAAGLTMEEENLDAFRRRINKIARLNLSGHDFMPELQIASDIDLEKIDMKFWKLLSQFEPFGPGNMRPVFVSKDVCIEGVPTIVGSGHLKMKVRQKNSGIFDAIGFNMHEYEPLLRNCDKHRVDIAYVLEENHWNGRRMLQMRLKDIHVDGTRENEK